MCYYVVSFLRGNYVNHSRSRKNGIDKDNNVEYFLALPNNNSIQWVVDLKTLNDITLHADMFEEYYSDNDLVTSKTTEISELPYEKTGTKDKQ